MGVRRNFSMGGNIDILLIVSRLLTMQCKWTFTKHFTLPNHIKCPMLWQQSQKCASLAALTRYITIIYTCNKLPADFKSGPARFKEALPWYLTKPQIVTVFFLARLVSVTSKQELQPSGISSKAVNVWKQSQKSEPNLND